jgi:type I restriction enzyme S subunit
MDEKLVASKTKQTHYQSLKRGLMQKLLIGAWRVRVEPSMDFM